MVHVSVDGWLVASVLAFGDTAWAQQPSSDNARFTFRQMAANKEVKHFAFEVRGRAAIDEMRAARADRSNPKRHVSGVVDPHKAAYNLK